MVCRVSKIPEVDDILLQEIQSLKSQLSIAFEIIKSYNPSADLATLHHDLATEDLKGAYEFNQEYEYKIDHLEKALELACEELKRQRKSWLKCPSDVDCTKCTRQAHRCDPKYFKGLVK